MTSHAVLVVDDDPAMLDTVEDGLRLGGFSTLRASDGHEALEILRTSSVDLAIVDVNMPRLDGFELVERMRSRGLATPVIFLTARHDREDVTQGFVLGADDYVAKPFRLEELLLRVSAILRRTSPQTSALLTCGPIRVDPDRHEAFLDAKPIELSPTEFRLLEYLLERKGRVLTKDQILDAVWGIDFDTQTTVVETFVSYLRKKFHPVGTSMIQTVRGIGYKIVEPT
jgi:two-component system OmpR family response regulator